MRLGWVNDFAPEDRPGGAATAIARLGAAKPSDVDLVPIMPGSPELLSCDAYVLFLTKRFAADEMAFLLGARFVSCPFDWWPPEDGASEYARRRTESARLAVWASPLHRDRARRLWKIEAVTREATIPPPIDPAPYDAMRASVFGQAGTLWAGEWSWHKGPDVAGMWALRNRERVDFYSPSMGAQDASQPWIFNPFCRPKGFCPPEKWLETFASYERFLHTSRTPDAFGYAIVEAWLLGLECVVSGVTGVESYELPLEKLVKRCAKAPRDFWRAVEGALS